MPTYRIRNWRRHQHFSNRRPPWIKLYRDILDDPDWHQLDISASKTLIMLWLLASETTDGTLPTIERIAFRLRTTKERISEHLQLLSGWIEQVDINAISPRYQDDAPERETEGEKRQRESRGRGEERRGEGAIRSADFAKVLRNIDGGNGEHERLVRSQAAAMLAKGKP